MAETSNIEWTDGTFNPWIGCTKVSPACDHCYAEVSTPARTLAVKWGPHAERRRTTPANWKTPVRWNAQHDEFFAKHGRRRRVFCASLADWLDNAVPIEWFVDLLDLIRLTPNLDWLMLSKRIGIWRSRMDAAADFAFNHRRDELHQWIRAWLDGMPPAHVRIGATICNQQEADRDIPKLLEVPARVRFLSMEPLLGPVDLRAVQMPDGDSLGIALDSQGAQAGIDWVIVGGESGKHARPIHPDWARDIRDQCAAAGVPFLFKQWGEWKPISEMTDGESDQYYRSNRIAKEWEDQRIVDEFCGRTCDITDAIGYGGARGFDKAYYVVNDHNGVQRGGMQVFKVGKKAAGRLLNGVQHDGYPKVHE